MNITAWKVSKYGVISGLYFPLFGLNTEINGVNLRIQSEYRKIRTRNNPVFGHFSRSVILGDLSVFHCSLSEISYVFFSHFIEFSIFYGNRCFKKTTFVGKQPFVQSSYVTRPCTTEIAFTGVLFGLSVIEFFVALFSSMYSSQFACCGKEGCCQVSKKGNYSCIIEI